MSGYVRRCLLVRSLFQTFPHPWCSITLDFIRLVNKARYPGYALIGWKVDCMGSVLVL